MRTRGKGPEKEEILKKEGKNENVRVNERGMKRAGDSI